MISQNSFGPLTVTTLGVSNIFKVDKLYVSKHTRTDTNQDTLKYLINISTSVVVLVLCLDKGMVLLGNTMRYIGVGKEGE